MQRACTSRGPDMHSSLVLPCPSRPGSGPDHPCGLGPQFFHVNVWSDGGDSLSGEARGQSKGRLGRPVSSTSPASPFTSLTPSTHTLGCGFQSGCHVLGSVPRTAPGLWLVRVAPCLFSPMLLRN